MAANWYCQAVARWLVWVYGQYVPGHHEHQTPPPCCSDPPCVLPSRGSQTGPWQGHRWGRPQVGGLFVKTVEAFTWSRHLFKSFKIEAKKFLPKILTSYIFIIQGVPKKMCPQFLDNNSKKKRATMENSENSEKLRKLSFKFVGKISKILKNGKLLLNFWGWIFSFWDTVSNQKIIYFSSFS